MDFTGQQFRFLSHFPGKEYQSKGRGQLRKMMTVLATSSFFSAQKLRIVGPI
jgi:hypothetical protein